MVKKVAKKLLDNWVELNKYLMGSSATEAGVLALLEEEKVERRRPSVLNRLYSNYALRRKNREREELAKLKRG